MFIAVGIDDEHYSELFYTMSDDLSEVKNAVEDYASEYGIAIWKLAEDADRDKYILRGEFWKNYQFFVSEIFEVSKESPYFLVHWHAYNGVDFGVEEFESIEAAKIEMERRWSEDQELYFEDTCRDSNFLDDDESIFDTGYEWKMHKIVRNERAF